MAGNANNIAAEIHALHAAALRVFTKLQATIEDCRQIPRSVAKFSRVKSVPNIDEKISRKRRTNKPDYLLEDVTDVIGWRFVTLFKSQIPEIVEALFALVNGKQRAKAANELYQAKVMEFIQYVSRPTDGKERDGLSALLEKVLEVQRPCVDLQLQCLSRENYSSVHIVLWIEADDDSDLSVPVEIQIRTIFENAWGEVDHQLFYEIDRSDPDASEDRRRHVKPHLSILKQLMDAAADYAGIINLSSALEDRQPNVAMPTLDGWQYVDRISDRLEVPSDLRKLLVNTIRKKEEIDESALSTPNEKIRDYYVEQAASFRDLHGIFEKKFPQNSDNREIFYLISMEEAICRLLSGESAQVRIALDQYRLLCTKFPDHLACWFRRGQAAVRVMEQSPSYSERQEYVEEAIACYVQTRRALNDLDRLDPSARELKIADDQRKLVFDRLPRLQGFALWIKSYQRRQEFGDVTDADASDVALAIDLAQDALPHASQEEAPKLRHNLLYYLVEQAEIALALDRNDGVRHDEIGQLTEEVAKEAGTKPHWRRLHTLLRANILLSRKHEQRDLAARLLKSIAAEDRGVPAKEEQELMQAAQELAADVLYDLSDPVR